MKKLKSQAGETIAEVLVALLISSLALVMLASMISATQKMVMNSENKMVEYYDANNILENLNTTPDGSLTVNIEDSTETFSGSYVNPYFVNDTFGAEVYAYGSP